MLRFCITTAQRYKHKIKMQEKKIIIYSFVFNRNLFTFVP